MNILVDIGNTRIKWCEDENGLIGSGQAIEYKKNQNFTQIEQCWLKLSPPDLLAVSSVGTYKITSQINELAKKIWPNVKVVNAKSSESAFSVVNAYPQAEKLGIDRWLGLIALRQIYPGNNCFVDCGTALTVDCLDDTGKHLGGVISPGLELMKQSLFKETSALNSIDQHYPVALANSTEPAIYSGIVYAATGLIEKTVKSLCHCEKLVLTGGDASIVAKHLAFKSIIEPDFILKGLSLYCKGEKRS